MKPTTSKTGKPFFPWKIQDVSDVYIHRARERWKMDDLDGALEELRNVLQNEPENPEACVIRGMIFAEKGMIGVARCYIELGLALGGPEWHYATLVLESLKKLENTAA